LQFLRDENKRLLNELELERRKSPAWREIRKYNVMLDFLKEQTKNQKDIIAQLKSTIQKIKER
jgi:CII-binding regulator of phage lambda lysogenization HflD